MIRIPARARGCFSWCPSRSRRLYVLLMHRARGRPAPKTPWTTLFIAGLALVAASFIYLGLTEGEPTHRHVCRAACRERQDRAGHRGEDELKLDPANHPWMRSPQTRAVIDALGGSARFVGGAVRNALMGEAVGEIDIATPLVPEEVTKRLKAAGLDAVPTGIEHGTVTAISNGKPFEITTLRRDVSDRRTARGRRLHHGLGGRRATPRLHHERALCDAGRRDRRLCRGRRRSDAGRVRFVGDPATRIREDYLRILRLFRFHAWYGKGDLDAEALRAASAGKDRPRASFPASASPRKCCACWKRKIPRRFCA